MIHKVFSIKECLKRRINMTLQKEPELYKLLLQVFVYGTAYIVGGFVRDALLDKQNRDIDIIVEIDKKILYEIIEESGCSYDINRHGGIKLHLASFDVDIWTIDSNWAFEKGLVNLKESKKCRLECIAKGCFYNYDSLVVNIHDKSFDIHNYSSFLKNKELDILMSSSSYKNLNPTIEANVIRAFYIKYKYGVSFSSQLKEYIFKKVLPLGVTVEDSLNKILAVKAKYPKYNDYLDAEFIYDLKSLLKEITNKGILLM